MDKAQLGAEVPRRQSIFADEGRRRQSIADMTSNATGESVPDAQLATCDPMLTVIGSRTLWPAFPETSSSRTSRTLPLKTR
jgi:hypothetical protein